MKVLFVALGTEQEPCCRVRIHQYLPFLASRGVAARVVAFYPRPPRRPRTPGEPARPGLVRRLAHRLFEAQRALRVAWLARSHDVVLVQRVLLPIGLQRILRRCCRVLLFDFDDAIYTTHAGAIDAVPHAAERFAHMLGLVDAAVVSTEPLAERARRHCRRVFVIPSSVDCERYRPRGSAPPENRATPRAAPQTVTVGWIGQPSTAVYLDAVLPLLRRLAAADANLRIRLVGAAPESASGLAECVPWSHDSELAELARFDIGIMPLSDDEWARAKAGYKILQYFACGIPAVASPVGVNTRLVSPGETGFLASTEDEWTAALLHLIRDPAARRRMGQSARRRVEADWSLRVWEPALLSVLRAASADLTVPFNEASG